MKKLTALLLCVMLVMSVMPVAFAAEGDWTGSGTENDPYVISDVAGLQKLADDVNDENDGNNYAGTYFKLGADIDMTGISLHIGALVDKSQMWPTVDKAFAGVFDGDNHEIKNYAGSDTYHAALFSAIVGTEESPAEIKNLTISGTAQGNKWVAGIVSYANYAKISNCVSNVNLSKIADWQVQGGIAAYTDNTDIIGCTNNGTIYANNDSAGGIVGRFNSGTIEDCINNGDITITNFSNIGGIAGFGDGSGVVITRCINNGDIIPADGNESNGSNLGGILGYFNGKEQAPVISKCLNTGNLNKGSKDTGCIVGKILDGKWDYRGLIEDCYNIGSGAQSGLVGALCKGNNVFNCYSIGTSPAPAFGWKDGSNSDISGIYVLAETTEFTQITEADLTNGNLTALLNGDRTGEDAVWVQGDKYPVLKVFSDGEVVEPVETTASISAVDGATVTYSVTLADDVTNATVIVALYNGNALVAVKTGVDAGADKTVTFANYEGATKAKIFVWGSLATTKPITVNEFSIGE